MPNFDGGHYFLTALVPIKHEIDLDDEGAPRSAQQRLRQALDLLPTARQSPASVDSPLNSAFARSKRTHFARFVVIDDVVYNGRMPQNAIVTALTGTNPVIPREIDQLNCPYLVFVADFDAKSGEETEVRGYLRELWEVMEPELRAVFRYCRGFDQVKDADGFVDYLLKCQVETTMPFNDYWVGPPPLKDFPILKAAAPVAVTAAAAAVGLLFWVFRIELFGWPWGWIGLAGLALTALGLALLYITVMRRGARPFPAAPNSDLPSVLKALYLQRHFVAFAIDTQGDEPADLYRKFGDFVKTHRPDDPHKPTQEPGVLRS